jgi:cell wall-associated NlpC family hydrolase
VGRQSQDVVVRFIGDTGNLARGADGLKGRFVGVASSLDGIAKAGAAIAALSFFKNAIGEAREAGRVTRQTEQVLRSTGAVAGVTSKHIAGLSAKLSELAGVDDEVIQHGANVLLTFKAVRNEVGSGNDVFDQATKVALDMSAALSESGDAGADLQSSVTRIGKALQDPIRGISALTKVGVSFSQQQKDQIAQFVEQGNVAGAQKIILQELQSEYGGMAAASADSIGKAQVSWANFAEDVGGKVMPAVTAVSDWTLSTGIPALGRLATTVGDVVEPAFHGMVDVGRGAVDMWQELPSPIQNAALAMGAWMLVGDRVTGFFGRTTGPLRMFGQDVQTVMSASGGEVGRFGANMQVLQDRVPVIGAMGVAFRTAKGDVDGFGASLRGVAAGGMAGLKGAASGLVNFLGGGWGLAVGGAAAILSIWISRQNAAKQAAAAHEARIKSLTQEIVDNGGEVSKQTKLQQIQTGEQKKLYELAGRLGISQRTMTQAILGNKDAIAEVNRAFDEYNIGSAGFNGSTKRAQEELQGFAGTENWGQLSSALTLARRDFGGLSGEMIAAEGAADSSSLKLNEVEAAAAGVAASNQAATTATDLFRGAIEGAGIEFDESAGLATQLRDAIDALTRSEIAQMDTLEGYEASLDSLDAAIQENGATLDIHTAAGRANRDALEEVAQKSKDLMQADIDAGVPMDQALARHQARVDALKQEATAAFGANSDALTLINTYGSVPKSVITAIQTQGLEAVQRQLRELSAGQYLLQTGTAITPANTRAVLNERRNRFSGGGFVSGEGTPRSDSIPAMLSNREFVQRADAVDYYGVPFMSALNQKRIPRDVVPGFAAGGMVWPFKVDVSKTKIPNPAIYPGGSSIAAMQGFARMQQGKRYQWGATGPSTWDCSGLVGAIWALAHGRDPYQRYMTTATMGVGRHGMKAGRGAVTVYLGPGHTAANIGGLHAEAYGGNGTPLAIGRVGTPLSFYTQVMHMAKGGLAKLKSDPAERYRRFLESGWPEPGRVGQFRNGGWLEPGHYAYNETSKPEAVFNQDQLKSLRPGKVEKHYHLTMQTRNYAVDVAQQFARMEALAGL